MIIYEAPHRLVKTLTELMNILGQDRKIAVCKELTKNMRRYSGRLFLMRWIITR